MSAILALFGFQQRSWLVGAGSRCRLSWPAIIMAAWRWKRASPNRAEQNSSFPSWHHMVCCNLKLSIPPPFQPFSCSVEAHWLSCNRCTNTKQGTQFQCAPQPTISCFSGRKVNYYVCLRALLIPLMNLLTRSKAMSGNNTRNVFKGTPWDEQSTRTF